MQPKSRNIIPVVALVALVAIGGLFFTLRASDNSAAFTLSGTIETTEIHLASQIGGRVKNVYADEGDFIRSGQDLIDVYGVGGRMNESITSPIDGVVLQRLIQPGELASPGSTLLVVANLNALTLKVYVSEDRYGQIAVGQTYPVTVDSFPDETFTGRVSYIADQAEFTPRNVQTTDSRKSTVFAIKLDLDPAGGKLKPGMPADVHFQLSQ
ncbi:MAG TPA: efflux RND transporter periplasmic adaptor subunit [Aggregatilineales bacterium]|nr:efflux RND transporter periplasmic adaptor subunit [Aggregatilineales bacterium]